MAEASHQTIMEKTESKKALLDSDDSEMDEILTEFAKGENTEEIVQLSDSGDELDSLLDEFADAQASENEKVDAKVILSDDDEMENLLEEFREENIIETSSPVKEKMTTQNGIKCITIHESDHRNGIIYDNAFEIALSDDSLDKSDENLLYTKGNESVLVSSPKIENCDANEDDVNHSQTKNTLNSNVKKHDSESITSNKITDTCFESVSTDQSCDKKSDTDILIVEGENSESKMNSESEVCAKKLSLNEDDNLCDHSEIIVDSSVSEENAIKLLQENKPSKISSISNSEDVTDQKSVQFLEDCVTDTSKTFLSVTSFETNLHNKNSSLESQKKILNNSSCNEINFFESEEKSCDVPSDLLTKIKDSIKDISSSDDSTADVASNHDLQSAPSFKILSNYLTKGDLSNSANSEADKIVKDIIESLKESCSSEDKDAQSASNNALQCENNSTMQVPLGSSNINEVGKENCVSQKWSSNIANQTSSENSGEESLCVNNKSLWNDNQEQKLEVPDLEIIEDVFPKRNLNAPLKSEIKIESLEKVSNNVNSEPFLTDSKKRKLEDDVYEINKKKKEEDDDDDRNNKTIVSCREINSSEYISIKEEKKEQEKYWDSEMNQACQDMPKIEKIVKVKLKELLPYKSEIFETSKKKMDKIALSIFEEIFEQNYRMQLNNAEKIFVELKEKKKKLISAFDEFSSQFDEQRISQKTSFSNMAYKKPGTRAVGVNPAKKEVPKTEASTNKSGRKVMIKPFILPKTEASINIPGEKNLIKPPLVPITQTSRNLPQNGPLKEKIIPQILPTVRPNIRHVVSSVPSKIPPPNIIKSGNRLIPYLPNPNQASTSVASSLIPKEIQSLENRINTAGNSRDSKMSSTIFQGSNVLVPLNKFLQMFPPGANGPVLLTPQTKLISSVPSNMITYVLPPQDSSVKRQLPSSQPQSNPSILRVNQVPAAAIPAPKKPVVCPVKPMTVKDLISAKQNYQVNAQNTLRSATTVSTNPMQCGTVNNSSLNHPVSSGSHSQTPRTQQLGVMTYSNKQKEPTKYTSVFKKQASSPMEHLSASKQSCPPLPESPQYVESSEKPLPPKPVIKALKKDDGKSIFLSWNLPQKKHVAVKSYQIFSCQVKTETNFSQGWKKTGDVQALVLPMACTLRQFEKGNIYYFIIRTVDALSRSGPFSDPVSINF